MTFDLRTLRYFAEVAEAGTVTAAAVRLRVSQPALSRAVQGLERQVGTHLFDRTGGRLQVSAAGAVLLPLVRDLLVRAEEVEAAACSIGDGGLRRLRIAAPATTVSDAVAPFLATFDVTDPLPSVEVAPASEVYSLLDGGAADLVLTPTPPPDSVVARVVAEFPIWLYVSPDDPRAVGAQVDLRELQTERLLVMPPSYMQRQLLERAATDIGVRFDDAREVSSPQVAQALCAAGWGSAVVTDDPRFGLTPCRIDTPDGPLVMRMYAAWPTAHFAADQIAAMADRMRTFCSTIGSVLAG